MNYKKILIIGTGIKEIPPTGYGGIERYVHELAEVLELRGMKVSIMNKVVAQSPDLLKHAMFALYVIKNHHYLKDTIIHANTPLPAICARFFGHRYIYTTHSRYWFGCPSLTKKLLHILDILAVAMSTVTIAPSQRLALMLDSKTYKPARVVFVPPGIHVPKELPPLESRENLVIGFGAVIKAKRLDILAEATKDARFEIAIIGPIMDINLRDKLLKINPRLQFLGELSDDIIDNILTKAKVMVHEADNELLPVTPLRALGHGVPVIGSSEISGIVNNGQTGFIVNSQLEFSERVSLTSKYLHILLENEVLWQRFSLASFVEMDTRFSWKIIGERVQDIYTLFEEIQRG